MNNEIIFDTLRKIMAETKEGTAFEFSGILKKKNADFKLFGIFKEGRIWFYAYMDDFGSYLETDQTCEDWTASFDDIINLLKSLTKDNKTKTIKCPFVSDFDIPCDVMKKYNCKLAIGYRGNITRLYIKDNAIDFKTKTV